MTAGIVSFVSDPFHSARIQTGYYTGNGTSRNITCNFVPDLVIIQRAVSDGTMNVIMKGGWATDWASEMWNAGNTGTNNAINQITGAGFTVSANADLNGIVYYWWAIKSGG